MTRAQEGLLSFAVAALGFCCLMPYLAVAAGNNSAVQWGNLLTLALAPLALLTAWRSHPYWIYPVLLAPTLLATLRVGLSGGGELSLAWKSTVIAGLSYLTIVVAQRFGAAFLRPLLTGLAIATPLHAAMGAWQFFAFPAGEVPLLEYYNNPSFLSLQDHAKEMALYMQRPFGFFPEPSAMASSLAPWVLLWIGMLSGVIKLNLNLTVWHRRLFALAAASGIGLMIISQSGHTAITLAAAMLLCAVWVVRARPTIGTMMLTFIGCVVAAGVLAAAASSLSNRIAGASLGNGSWEDRFNSLVLGFRVAFGSSAWTAAFGLGPGLSTPILWNEARLDAVWSVLLTYIYETGFVGFIAVMAVAVHLLRCWQAARFEIGFAVITIVWTVGITLTTSYDQLLSIWLTLGVLSVWPAISAAANVSVPVPASAKSAPAAVPEKPRSRSDVARSPRQMLVGRPARFHRQSALRRASLRQERGA